jgi:MFS transporter, ACS family, glucarate transporter
MLATESSCRISSRSTPPSKASLISFKPVQMWVTCYDRDIHEKEMGSQYKTSVRWFVAALVGAFAFVSYIERMNISVAAALMMPELSLSGTQMGQIFSSFLWGYAIFQVPAGWLGDVVGPRITLTVAALIWCITSVLTGFLPGTYAKGAASVILCLWILRFLLGAGEAATFPVGARAIRNWTPLWERGIGNSIMIAGASIAASVTSPLVSWLMTVVGWRASFYIVSLAALFVAMIWYFSVTDYPEQHRWAAGPETESYGSERGKAKSAVRAVSLANLLKNRNVLLLSLSYTCEGYVLFIFVFWLYLYLIQVRGFTILSGGFAASLPWLTAFACTPLGGWLCDRLAEKNGRIAAARTVIMIGYGVSGVLLFTAAMAAGRNASVAALCLSIGGLYFAEPAFWATAVHISGENVGASSGLMNTAGILGGIVSTSLVPVLVEHFGWITALGSGAMVALVCTGVWMVMGRMGFGTAAPEYAAQGVGRETESRA